MDKDEVDMMVEGYPDLPEEFIEYLQRMQTRRTMEELAPRALPQSLAEWIKQDKKKDPN